MKEKKRKKCEDMSLSFSLQLVDVATNQEIGVLLHSKDYNESDGLICVFVLCVSD